MEAVRRPVFSFRPNLEYEEHRRAWEILQRIPEGQKNLFLVRAILHEQDREYLEQVVQKAVREELKGCRVQGVSADRDASDRGSIDRDIADSETEQMFESGEQQSAGRVPEQVLDFISMLQEE